MVPWRQTETGASVWFTSSAQQRPGRADLLDEEALEGDVLAGFVRKRHGDDVGQPLRLVDDGVREGKRPPVFNLDLTGSYHPAELLLDLVWGRTPVFPCV